MLLFVKGGDRVEVSAAPGICSPLECPEGGGEGEVLSVGEESTWTLKAVLLRFKFDLSPFTCMYVSNVQQ